MFLSQGLLQGNPSWGTMCHPFGFWRRLIWWDWSWVWWCFLIPPDPGLGTVWRGLQGFNFSGGGVNVKIQIQGMHGQSLSLIRLFVTPWTVAPAPDRPAPTPRLLCSLDFPGKNAGVGCHFLLQGIFPPQGLNLCFLPWQEDSLSLCHLGSPRIQGGISQMLEGRRRCWGLQVLCPLKSAGLAPCLLSPRPVHLTRHLHLDWNSKYNIAQVQPASSWAMKEDTGANLLSLGTGSCWYSVHPSQSSPLLPTSPDTCLAPASITSPLQSCDLTTILLKQTWPHCSPLKGLHCGFPSLSRENTDTPWCSQEAPPDHVHPENWSPSNLQVPYCLLPLRPRSPGQECPQFLELPFFHPLAYHKLSVCSNPSSLRPWPTWTHPWGLAWMPLPWSGCLWIPGLDYKSLFSHEPLWWCRSPEL